MNHQQSIPEQQQGKRSKAILWLSILLIIAVGLAIFIYFTLANIGDDGITNTINTNTNIELRCRDWEPGLCDAEISPGYYYNSESGQCSYFSGGSGCSSPSFEALEECQSVCASKVINVNLNVNSSTTQTCNDITTEVACRAREDCLTIDYCSGITENEWHDKCNVEQTEFITCDMAGFILCDELYCSDKRQLSRSEFCKWRPTKDYGTCEIVIGAYYNGSTCVTISGCPGGSSMLIPFWSLDDCNKTCNNENVDLFNGSVSLSCEYDSDCHLVSKTKDFSACCPDSKCFDYGDSNYVAVNLESFQDLNREIQSQWDCPPCPLLMPPECPETLNNQYVAECINNVCEKNFY